MRFLYTYTPGKVPQSEMEENMRQWGEWIAKIKEKAGIRVAAGKVVSSTGVAKYEGDFGGASIVEAESLADALKIAESCPGLKYGGTVTVFEEWQ
ncbi:MAG TPA: YciI family protein [Ktedonobacteraceae bacterium]|nr:YciI family protein [Ktedonobacteraceae bacterium]